MALAIVSTPSYHRRRPEETVLYRALQRGLDSFIDAAAERGREVPSFVDKELRGYLTCGRLEHGFARVHCPGCGYDRLVAFSCMGRGFCPSCGGRRMADTAARLVDRVLPTGVPYRQFVLSLPPPLRYLLAYDSSLVSYVVGAFTGAIGRWQRHQAKERYGLSSVREAHTGAITAIQRFGSALNLNVHAHTIVPDGVFVEENETLRFRRIGAPNETEIEEIAWETCVRTVARLRKEGRWVDEDGTGGDAEDTLALEQPLLCDIYGASITGRLALGPQAGQRVMRFGAFPKAVSSEARQRLPAVYGFDVHARVNVEAHDRKGLERLCRYLLRPPASNERFTETDDGRIALRLKRAWSDGTTHVLFTPAQLAEKLAAIIPPPRANQIRYHGVFAPRHTLRQRVVPKPSSNDDTQKQEATSPCRHRIEWAKLMRRVFDIDVLACPKCDNQMQRIAFITKPDAIRKILDAVGYAADSPRAAA